MVPKWKWGLASVKGTCVEHALQDFRVIFVKLFGGTDFASSLPLVIVAVTNLMANSHAETGSSWGIKNLHAGGSCLGEVCLRPWVGEEGEQFKTTKRGIAFTFLSRHYIVLFPNTWLWKSLPFFRLSSEPTSLSHVVSRKQCLGTIDWGNSLWKKQQDGQSLIGPYKTELLETDLRNLKLWIVDLLITEAQ